MIACVQTSPLPQEKSGNEGTAFIPALQMARPSHGSDDLVKSRSCFYASLRIFVISDLAITLTDFHAV